MSAPSARKGKRQLPRRWRHLRKLSYVLLLLSVGAASTQLTQAQSEWDAPHSLDIQGVTATPTPSPVLAPTAIVSQRTPVPTVIVPEGTPVPIPTILVPKPKPKPKPRQVTKRPTRTPTPGYQWIWAFLTSYCPGTAGWISSSGRGVFYGMLANDYYPFGTRVYMPVLGMTGVVEDRFGGWVGWNYFDVWSPICYATPTGWFKVAIVQ